DTALGGATSGITDNADVRLTAGGNLTIDNLVSLTSAGDLTLNVTGTVTQTAAISAKGLQPLGTGAGNLDSSANDVTTIAASHSGTLSYRDPSGPDAAIFRADAALGGATSGITDNADVRLTAGGPLTIDNLVSLTSAGDLTLNITGTVTQT